MSRPLFAAALACGLAALAGGCASFSTMQTASAVDEGKFRVSIGAETVTVGATGSSSGSLTAPQIEVAGRYGLGNGMDFGAKLWLLGFEGDFKKEVVHTGSHIVSAGLGVSYSGIHLSGSTGGSSETNLGNVTIHVPILYGFKLSGGSELVIGPRFSDSIYFSNGNTTNTLLAGGTIGFAFKLGENFYLMPEVSIATPLNNGDSFTFGGDTSSNGGRLYLIQGGIGFHFGG